MSLPAQAADEPIRLGFLTIKSGALAAGGKQMEDGLRLFLKERNNMIAGRKVELFVGDTAGQPAITKTKAQELVEKNKVHVIIGPLAAFEALAIDDYIRKSETPIISPSAAAEDLTQRKPNPWFVRAVGTSAQPHHPLGEYAAKTLELQAHRDHRRRLRLRPRDRRRASSAPSRTTAARSCKSSGRR